VERALTSRKHCSGLLPCRSGNLFAPVSCNFRSTSSVSLQRFQFALAAPACPDPSILKLTCTPVTCNKAGEKVPLAGSCTSVVAGANFTYYVDGAAADSVTCPTPGVSVRVEPSMESCYGIPSCSYREPALPPFWCSHWDHGCLQTPSSCRVLANRNKNARAAGSSFCPGGATTPW
jgi:hypothetical protein